MPEFTMPEPDSPQAQGSVWLTGQAPSRDQRRGRYLPASLTHPGKMLPTIARYLIATYTHPGDIVCDPMAGIATTVIEAMHLGRHGIGVEYEPQWAQLAAANIDYATAQGATGTGRVYIGDSRHLPTLIPPHAQGQVAFVITSPPYGPSTHGHVRTPGPRRGKVRKIDHKYGADSANLAYRDHDELATGFQQILAGCAAVLRPGGHIAVTARPYRRHGKLIDIPGMVESAGTKSGLTLIDRCAALIAGVRDGRLIARPSFFQLKNIRAANDEGDPQWVVQHEDVLIFTVALSPAAQHDAESGSARITTHADRLDVFTPSRVDRRAHPAPPANANPSGSAMDPRPHPGRDVERTPDPCPPYSHPKPGDVRTDTTVHGWSDDPDRPSPQPDSSTPAGRR